MTRHDYERDTRRYYQDRGLAGDYHQRFTRWRGLRSLPSVLVAHFERQAVKELLLTVPHGSVLDVPAGTGKLAPVFSALGCEVVSCDISPEMLEVARQEYRTLGYERVEFHVCEAEQVSRVLDGGVDAAVCLRLLHLVPPAKQEEILAELGRCAPHLVVSFGVDSPYHRLRRQVRTRLFGGDPRGTDCHEPLERITARLAGRFAVRERRWVMPGLSAEVVFLLEPREAGVQRVEFLGLPGSGKSELAGTLARGLPDPVRVRTTAPGRPGPGAKVWGALRTARRAPGLVSSLVGACRPAGRLMGASLAVHWLETLDACAGKGVLVLDQGLAQLLWALVYHGAAPSIDTLERLLGPGLAEPVAVVLLAPDPERFRVPAGRVAGGREYRYEAAVAALEKTRELLEELAGLGYPLRLVDFDPRRPVDELLRSGLGRDLSAGK